MRQITRERLTKCLAEQRPPCVSLYMPTHRQHPENRQDPIRYGNLLQQIEKTLQAFNGNREVNGLLEKFQTSFQDDKFWNHRTEGLAILGSPDFFEFFELQRPVEELLVVADSFHIKPLLRALQTTDRYQILGLNRQAAKLYEGNRDALDEIELAAAVPETIEEALGNELSEAHLTAASYGGSGGAKSGIPSMHHGHGHKKDEVEIDENRFFRAIDRAILEHHSRPTGLPLILAALPEHHDMFHKVSHNPFLIENGIDVDPHSISMDRLRAEVWQVVEPHLHQQSAKLVDNFKLAEARQLGSSDLTEIAHAMLAGRVEMLLVEADRQIPGKLDTASGAVEFLEFATADVDDLLDDLAELTLKMGGEVIVMPSDRMPSTSGAAATFRY